MFNLNVRKSIDQTPGLEEIRAKTRKIVGHFCSITTAKEKLCQKKLQMGRPQLKLLQEVDMMEQYLYHAPTVI